MALIHSYKDRERKTVSKGGLPLRVTTLRSQVLVFSFGEISDCYNGEGIPMPQCPSFLWSLHNPQRKGRETEDYEESPTEK